MTRIAWCNLGEINKELEFEKLVDCVQNCSLCSEMEARSGVLSELNGNIYSNILFIAEAPGRLGADRTRIPLFGDQTGVNFQRLIDTIGWSRENFFITNAVLCNPRDNAGNNTTPCKKHIKNCSVYLNILIKIMDPDFVVTLGQKAIEAINDIEEIKITLKKHVRTTFKWYGRTLIPLYHMGPRALIHRNFYNQLSDFYWLQHIIEVKSKPWERLKKSSLYKSLSTTKFNPTKLQKLIIEVLTKTGPISEFKLTKMIYLVDYYFLKTTKKLLTNSFYLRAYAGPLPMGLEKQLMALKQEEIVKINYGKTYSLNKFHATDFTKDEFNIIYLIIDKYIHKSDNEIKTLTYLTFPMRRILKKEKATNESMIWKPVFIEDDFKNP